jgi:CRP-like cAMP-binding protein
MIRSATLTESYRNVPFFKGLDTAYLQKLEALGHELTFGRDQVIFREGDESSFFYVILTGRVSLEVTALGRTLRVQTIGENEEFGWSSLLPSHGKQFQARALESLHVLAFDGPRLREACDEDVAFGYALMKRVLATVSHRLLAMRVQMLDMYSPGGK